MVGLGLMCSRLGSRLLARTNKVDVASFLTGKAFFKVQEFESVILGKFPNNEVAAKVVESVKYLADGSSSVDCFLVGELLVKSNFTSSPGWSDIHNTIRNMDEVPTYDKEGNKF